MACSGAGLVALLVLFVGVALNLIAFILPLWSTSDVVNTGLTTKVAKAQFTAGVWGYCTDAEFIAKSSSSDGELTFDHCYFFHTSNKYDLPKLAEQLTDDYSSYSICDGYSRAEKIGAAARKIYTTGLAYVAGMDATQFDTFIHRSCTFSGTVTLIFGVLASANGVLAFIGLVLSVTCCAKRSSFNAFVKALISFSFVSTVIMIAFWIYQSYPLGKKDEVNFSGSFVIAILSSVLLLIAGMLLARHAMLK